MKNRNLNLVSRILAPTPKWFRMVRTVGLALTAVGGALVASPVALPAALVTVGGYLLLSGSLVSAVSQTAVKPEEYGTSPADEGRAGSESIKQKAERKRPKSLNQLKEPPNGRFFLCPAPDFAGFRRRAKYVGLICDL